MENILLQNLTFLVDFSSDKGFKSQSFQAGIHMKRPFSREHLLKSFAI